MTVSRKLSSIGLAVVLSAASVAAMADVMVGGAPMLPSKDIIDNAVNSKDHTTLVAAVKAAGLVDTLKGPGPFTVFAPTNAAFAALPAGTVDTLLKPENKDKAYYVLAPEQATALFDNLIDISDVMKKSSKSIQHYRTSIDEYNAKKAKAEAEAKAAEEAKNTKKGRKDK